MGRFIFWLFALGLAFASRGLLIDATISVAKLAAEKYRHPMSYQQFTHGLLTARPRAEPPPIK